MQPRLNWFATALAIASALSLVNSASAGITVNSFDNFTSDALYASWSTATIVSGPTSYTITATGYGSNWKYNPVDGSGYTNLQLTVSLSGPAAAAGKLGPIVTLEDADGTSYNFAWYGRTLGSHVLTMPLKTPTWTSAPGTVPGLNLATLTHLHLQLDPSDYAGSYTVEWQDLSLTGAIPPQITAQLYNPTTHEFTLTWTSLPGKSYTILHTSSLSSPFTPLVTDVSASGTSTTATVVTPAGNVGFLRVQQQ